MRPMGGATWRASGRTAVEAIGLGRRHRRRWALRDCTFRLPVGRICALAGPHDAGKTTLLALACGLVRPTEGTVRVFGARPDEPGSRARVALVARERPLYGRLTVAETLRLGRALDPDRWCAAYAEEIVREGRVPLGARVGTLTAGQRTWVALALALGKDPELLLLDEPFADLDPLARHRIAALLMARTAAQGTTVVLSSHALAELDGLCDYVLVLGGGRVRLAGEADDVIGAHSLLLGPPPDGSGPPPGAIAGHTVVETHVAHGRYTALVQRRGRVGGPWEAVEPSLEEVLLGYLRAPDAPALIAPSAEPVSRRPRGKPGVPGLPRNGTPGIRPA